LSVNFITYFEVLELMGKSEDEQLQAALANVNANKIQKCQKADKGVGAVK